ncbi:MAG: response regulator [Bacillota bacterium]|nr:response regulator [Bacillota bacterium]
MSIVLIVDDEKSIRETFKAFILSEGHQVQIACDVKTALALMRQEPPDLIITDIIMPRISGMDFLNQIKKINPDVPVIVMTGEPTVETAQQSVSSGAFDYLMKPINKMTLLAAVSKALEHKRLLDVKKDLEEENRIHREQLEQLVRIRTSALMETINATITMISMIVEQRDPYTAGHQRKVGNLAAEISIRMGLSNDIVESLYVAGYLHDIGKVSVPAEILSKPGKLNLAEFEIIKSHVTYGYDVLSKVSLPWPIADIVCQHHERLDGSGYPNRLKDAELKIESKILAVADVIEAMTAHRPYRPSLGIDIALAEIKKNSGILYDPAVSAAAIDLFEEGHYQFSDEMHLQLTFTEQKT